MNTLTCYTVVPRQCDPLVEFGSPQTLAESVIALGVMYVGCYTISLILMKLLSRKYEWERDKNLIELSIFLIFDFYKLVIQ